MPAAVTFSWGRDGDFKTIRDDFGPLWEAFGWPGRPAVPSALPGMLAGRSDRPLPGSLTFGAGRPLPPGSVALRAAISARL
jgi:hypothetical protein